MMENFREDLFRLLNQQGFAAVPDVLEKIRNANWTYPAHQFATLVSRGIEPIAALMPDDYITQLKIFIGSMRSSEHPPLYANMPIRPYWFIGRAALLETLHQSLCETEGRIPLVLLRGIGGMGKTTIMQQYLNQNRCLSHFKRIVILRADKQIKSLFIGGVAEALGIDLKQIKEASHLAEIIRRMQLENGPNLLVLDNVNEGDMKELEMMLPHFENTGWTFLITTRTNPDYDGLTVIDVDELEMPDALQLFAWHHTSDNTIKKNPDLLRAHSQQLDKDEQLTYLLAHIQRHTLLTELLAKSARKRGFTPGKLNGLLDEIDKAHPENERWLSLYNSKALQTNISIGAHARKSKEEELAFKTTVSNYISHLFEVDYLITPTGNEKKDRENSNQLQMLHFFSVLTADDIMIKDLHTLWRVAAEGQIEFETRLDTLNQSGWIQSKQALLPENDELQNLSFRMHPLVQEVIYDKLKPDINSVRPLVITITEVLGKASAYPQNYQRYAKSVIDKLNMLKQRETRN
jgi:hypothetical protein